MLLQRTLGIFRKRQWMAPHSSTLAWKIPWTGEPGGLQSMGSRRVGHDWATSLSLFFTFMHWRRKWKPTPVFLPGKFHRQRGLVGYSLWGRQESDMTEQLTLSHLDSSYIYLKKSEVDFIFKWVQTTKSDDLASADIFWNSVSWIIHSLLQRDDEVKLKNVNSMSS